MSAYWLGTSIAWIAKLTACITSLSLCSVIKIILQFCKENGLTESFNAIQVCVSQ